MDVHLNRAEEEERKVLGRPHLEQEARKMGENVREGRGERV